MQTPNAQQIVLLLLIASVVSMLARRLRLPTASGLVAAGFALALIATRHVQVGLTQEVLFTAFLPALIFESALNLRASDLSADWIPLTVLVTVGVAVNMAVASAAMHFAMGWPWTTALLFGAITSATDPIAVLATFKQAGITGRPRVLAEAESLLNDGTAVVGLGLVLLCARHLTVGHMLSDASISALRMIGGGVSIGFAVGWLMTKLMGAVDDPLIETTLTFVGAYGSFFASSLIGGSGILAATACGLVMGNYGILSGRYASARGREIVEVVWQFAAFIANALVFLLMGLSLSHLHAEGLAIPIIAGISFGLLGRAVAVYSSCWIVSRSPRRVPAAIQHALMWGGQRGALSLVLAVAVYRSVPDGNEMIGATAGLVAFSVLAQGLSFGPLARKLFGIGAERPQSPGAVDHTPMEEDSVC